MYSTAVAIAATLTLIATLAGCASAGHCTYAEASVATGGQCERNSSKAQLDFARERRMDRFDHVDHAEHAGHMGE